MRLDGSTAQHGELRRRPARRHAVLYEAIEPRGRRLVLHKHILLQQHHEVLGRRVKVAPDRQLLQRKHHVLPRLLAVCAIRKHMPKLRVRILVQRATRAHTKVPPRRRRRSEIQLAQRADPRLEARVRVLCRDPTRDDVPTRLRTRVDALVPRVKVYARSCRRRATALTPLVHAPQPVQLAHVVYVLQRNPHRNLQLRRRYVDARHHLCRRVLDLQPRVQLQERKRIRLWRVQPLDRPGRHIANELREPHSRLLHTQARLCRRYAHGRLLNDLLVPPLHRAVAPEQTDRLAVLVRQHLHLQVPRCARELHHKHRRPRHLAHSRLVQLHEHVRRHAFPDALATASFRCLDHHGKAYALRNRQPLFCRVHTRSLVRIVRHAHISLRALYRLRDACARPRQAWHVCVLRHNRRRNLVAQRTHRRARRPQEKDPWLQTRQHLGQPRILRRMPPACPHGMHACSFRYIHNQLDICIVIRIWSTRDLDILVGHADVVSIDPQVIGRRHHCKLDRPLITKHIIRPFPHRADLFHGRNPIVAYKHLRDHTVPSRSTHKVAHPSPCLRRLCMLRRYSANEMLLDS